MNIISILNFTQYNKGNYKPKIRGKLAENGAEAYITKNIPRRTKFQWTNMPKIFCPPKKIFSVEISSDIS